MNIIQKLLTLLILLTGIGHGLAQEQGGMISGKLVTRGGDLDGTVVTNINRSKTTLADKKGYFDIYGEPQDTIRFSSVYHMEYTYVIAEADIKGGVLLFPLEPLPDLSTRLNEILITKVDAGGQGFTNKYTKRYTPAERKLRTATTGILDPLVNLLSGRTAMLKKNLAYEREDFRVSKLLNTIDEERLVEYYKIPPDYVESFAYYAVSREEIRDIVNATIIDTKFLERMIAPIVLDFLEMVKTKTK
ncbi:hypothetical protein HX038_01275 [Myroides odoratimimus]|uniref:DUF4369 domain-containing protein n=1 Tax=Myroides odoratimimus CCUG 10230 TaxID=883150 RepID=A0ABN0E7I2_9FLAO|nr:MULTISPECIES: hypothetical protein [Myroides]AJA68007.1 hypothetical protein MYRA21_0822 [Myroides sp. A21]EHO07088.1 hypothetical protein HMPREF9712_02877 [Myroides odoratimimus CCUG 10230]MDM1064089.1 hypothetical protein [Myroides odoratimimus]MDM1083476.1 hypothetical protein [Myroides odoratimimus]MDM1409383.1 hypothetical protein [Myroides odoratimimus]